MQKLYIDIEGSDEKLEVLTPFDADDQLNDSIKLMLDNNADEYGHLRLQGVPDDEIECYDWDEYDQEIVDLLEPQSELYILYDGIGDFEQPLGVVALMWK